MRLAVSSVLVTASFAIPASAQQAGRLAERFRQLDRNDDGKLTPTEARQAAIFKTVDANSDGFVTIEELREYYARRGRAARRASTASALEPAPAAPPPVDGRPALKSMPDSDAVRDAAGRGQLFESVHVAGFTDFRQGCNGFAIVDLNQDGQLDIVATFSPPRGQGQRWGRGELLRLWLGEGDFTFHEHKIKLLDTELTLDSFGRGQVPNLADFNGDGLLDLFVTRHGPSTAGVNRRGIESVGNSLFLADGAWDVFRDVSDKMGIRNEQAYNRQSSFGDIDGDGWLDIAIGCDNIKNAYGGVPHSRLYVFRPRGRNFIDGHFEDIGGTDLVPDFGGFYHDSERDKAGPDIDLRDLDNDGDLDLLQSYHVDVREPLLDYSPGEYRQGIMCWKNRLRETDQLRFVKVTGKGLHCEARLRYDRTKQIYEPAGDARAPGLPYVSLADVNHDGLMDVFAVGPNSPYWAPRIEDVSGRFWKNLGGFRFQEMTEAVGLDAINNTVRKWNAFFDAPTPQRFVNWRSRGRYPSQPGLTPSHPLDRHPYYADAIFGDFNNDGWLDVVVLDRAERPESRAILWMGQPDGTFECQSTTFSGLDAGGISGEAADLNNDGLLDLVFAADPDNSGVATDPRRYESRVYWNTGEHNARQNHWLRLCLTGLTHAEVIGARVEVSTGDRKQYRWIHSDHTYKSGGALDAHFGLGKATSADIAVTLLNGTTRKLQGVSADQTVTLNMNNGEAHQPRSSSEATGNIQTRTSAAAEQDNRPFLDLTFARDLVPGKDRHGKPMGGTECSYIVSHNGKLWAGLSCWKHDTSVSPLLGPQVLVKHAADADWELDFCFGPDYGTTKMLRSVAFTTDRHGKKLAAPVSLLIADATRWRPPYDVGVWTRDDTTGKWVRTVTAPEQPSNSVYKGGFTTEVRMIVDHIDNVTGVHHVFACTNQGKIHCGAYDPAALGRIAWERHPELDNRLRRTSSGGEANGDLYVSIGMDASDPENGGLFRRVDGREPFWKRVAGWPHHEAHQRRNLTSELRFSPIPNPDEKAADILLATQAHPVNSISRIDPDDDFRMTLDLDVQDYVSDRIPGARVMSIAANGFAPFRHPDTGEQVHLGGLWLYFRDQTDTPDANAAWYLVRYDDGTYGHGRIFDPNNPIPNRGIPGGLRDARTICVSPFSEDHGRVLYLGGFNCGTHYMKEKLINTAWIYKGTMPTKPIHDSRP